MNKSIDYLLDEIKRELDFLPQRISIRANESQESFDIAEIKTRVKNIEDKVNNVYGMIWIFIALLVAGKVISWIGG